MLAMTLFMCFTLLLTLDTSDLLWHTFCHVTNKQIWWWWWWWGAHSMPFSALWRCRRCYKRVEIQSRLFSYDKIRV